MIKLTKIIEGHRFFCRKSQFYIMGNWNEYEEWIDPGGKFNERKWRYMSGFLPAYFRFMWYSLTEN